MSGGNYSCSYSPTFELVTEQMQQLQLENYANMVKKQKIPDNYTLQRSKIIDDKCFSVTFFTFPPTFIVNVLTQGKTIC